MPALDLWPVLQAFALVTAGFGIWILARACWEYAGVPAVQDAYLQLVHTRLQQLQPEPVAAGAVPGAGSARGWAPGPEPLSIRMRPDASFRRRVHRTMAARPSPAERIASQSALLRLLGRPALELDQQELAARALESVRGPVAAAGSVRELARTDRLLRRVVAGMLREKVPGRFGAVFLPGMARYLDFVGRGSSLGLAAGVLLAGGLAGNADLVGALTTLCGVGGAIVFTLTVIRCEARSWPAGQAGIWLKMARRFPQGFFLLRLALTTGAALLALYIAGR